VKATQGRRAAALLRLAAAPICSLALAVQVADLRAVITRDGTAFTVDSIPATVLDRLARNQVVVVGETHQIREQGELMAALVRSLHARGFRQLLLEWPHMADWLLADYVAATGLVSGWTPSPTMVGGSVITAIRDFNRSLPESERIRVRAIDVNLSEYGGAASFLDCLRELSRHLGPPGPLTPFFNQPYATSDAQSAALTRLRGEIHAGRANLVAAWGVQRYDLVSEMLDVETVSVGIRARRKAHYDQTVAERETEMKRLADLRLDGYAHRTLVTVGSTHAQKSRLIGTDIEWLGDYLVHKSQAVGGPVFVICVTAARLVPDAADAAGTFDLMKSSPRDELWRSIHETWPNRIVFLPLDDRIFSAGNVRMKFEDGIRRGAPGKHFDAFVLLPEAHRVAERDR
jgi:hypothetical protein